MTEGKQDDFKAVVETRRAWGLNQFCFGVAFLREFESTLPNPVFRNQKISVNTLDLRPHLWKFSAALKMRQICVWLELCPDPTWGAHKTLSIPPNWLERTYTVPCICIAVTSCTIA